MGILNRVKNWLFPPKLGPRLVLPSNPEDVVELVRMQMGYVKGGIYTGITHIPGDPNKPWEEGEDSKFGSCPACGGTMRKLYQGADYEQDGEEIRYYKEVCKDCNFTNDAGRMMTQREIRASRYIYCDIVKGETFNRTGHSCDFIDAKYGEPVTRLYNWCEECPHPH